MIENCRLAVEVLILDLRPQKMFGLEYFFLDRTHANVIISTKSDINMNALLEFAWLLYQSTSKRASVDLSYKSNIYLFDVMHKTQI